MSSLWPKLKRDWKGLRVRLKYDTQNKGGGIFHAGTEFIVGGYYRGLELKREEACPNCKCKGWASISRVSPNSVELIPSNSIRLILDLNKEDQYDRNKI